MSWIAITLLFYVVPCYLALGWSLWACDDNHEMWERCLQIMRSGGWPRRVFGVGTMIVAFLTVGLFMPIIYGHCLWENYQRRNYMMSFARKHTETILEPIALSEMHPVGRQMIAEHESEIEKLHFELVNHYLYKTEPMLIENRTLLSLDQRTILELGHIDGDPFCSCVSVLASGAFVETTLTRCITDMQAYIDTGQVYIQTFDVDSGQHSVREIVAAHNQLLTEVAETKADQAIEIELSQTRDAIRYVNRKFGSISFQLDQIDEPPPPANWPFKASPPPQQASQPLAMA